MKRILEILIGLFLILLFGSYIYMSLVGMFGI